MQGVLVCEIIFIKTGGLIKMILRVKRKKKEELTPYYKWPTEGGVLKLESSLYEVKNIVVF